MDFCLRTMHTKARANGFAEEWRRYACGLAIVESKRWDLPLDRRFAQQANRAFDADASLFAAGG